MKRRLSSAASSKSSGGQSRVFEAPGCGVFAKMTIALRHIAAAFGDDNRNLAASPDTLI